jgi:hypothetical protein
MKEQNNDLQIKLRDIETTNKKRQFDLEKDSKDMQRIRLELDNDFNA